MNQRIRELATQAHEYALEVYEKRMQNEVQTQVFFYQIRDDKFAQLIVEKCVSTLEFHGFEDAVPYIRWMAANKLGVKP